MIKKISNFDEWNQCGSCAAFARCPIVTNIQFLKDKPTSRINDLLLISHLRRQKRATLRQVRSTLAWVITGDLGCEDVHEAVKNNVDLLEERNFGIQDLAFSELTNDPLVREWRDVDPSNLITPLLQQAIDKMPDSEDDLFWTESKYASYARKEFFGISKLLPSSQGEELDTYRSLDLFKSLVGSTQLEEGLDVLLKGFSSIMGSVGADRPGLSVSRSRLGDSWSTAKVIPRERFHLVSLNQADQYLEFQADGLMLTHDDGEHMRIDLDSFEIAYRASRGELFSDSKSEATRFEVKAFSRKLSQKVSDRVLIIDPAGESTEVEQDKGLIRLVRGTGERHE
jgi:hypothetical protein